MRLQIAWIKDFGEESPFQGRHVVPGRYPVVNETGVAGEMMVVTNGTLCWRAADALKSAALMEEKIWLSGEPFGRRGEAVAYPGETLEQLQEAVANCLMEWSK